MAATANRITSAVKGLARQSGDTFVPVTGVREALPDIPRAELDEALIDLYCDQEVNLVCAADPRTREKIGQENAIWCGGAYKYLVSAR